MKVRKKHGGYVISVTQQGNGTYKDDNDGKIYTKSDIDFKCPKKHLDNANVGEIICTYTEDSCIGLSPVKYKIRNVRIKWNQHEHRSR